MFLIVTCQFVNLLVDFRVGDPYDKFAILPSLVAMCIVIAEIKFA